MEYVLVKYAPLKTANFLFFVHHPVDTTETAHRKVAISSLFEARRAGDLFFKDPGPAWERMDNDEVLQVGRADWAISRLLHLLQELNETISLEQVSQSDEEFWKVRFEVREIREEQCHVADLILDVSKRQVGWSGQADTFYHASAPIEELEAMMSRSPIDVAQCEISIPARKTKVGWTGKRFRSQKKIKRPEFYSVTAIARRAEQREANAQRVSERKRVFAIDESPLSANDLSKESGKRNLRFTDTWPPVALWSTIPNWRHAYEEEGRSGQTEATLRPAENQSIIAENVAYTAGEAFLPDGSSIPALISVSDGEPRGVVCWGDETVWRFSIVRADGKDVECRLTPQQKVRFPLQVVSNLSRCLRDLTDNVRIRINETGGFTRIEI